MKAIERAKAHFTDFGVQSVEVPEWGEDGQPMVIYWKPINLAEKLRLQASDDRLADCLILKALDAEGKKMFTIEDKYTMRHSVDPDVIARVVVRMMASPGVREMGKP